MTELTDARLAVAAARMGRELAMRRMVDADIETARFLDAATGDYMVVDQQLNKTLFAEIEAARQAHPEAETSLAVAAAAHDQAIATYQALTTAAPLFEPGCADPVLLLPVRLEAVYRTSGTGTPELRIRVYPDDVHVDSHEPELTDGEWTAGTAYWREIRGAHTGADAAERRQAAWHVLAGAVGGDRAKWVSEVLTPTNDRAGAPEFPDVPRRDAGWNRAAHTFLLPDRFEFSAYRNGALTWRHTGADLPDQLPLGVAPNAGEEEPPADGPPFDAASRWLVDFPTAVALGMGLVVALESADERFDLLTAVGVSGQDAATTATRVQDALAAHTYSDGLAPLPVGTPTNNTPASRSGWRTRGVPTDPDTADAWRAAYDPASRQEAARLARALGIDGTQLLSGVCDPEAGEESLLRLMHRLQADRYGASGVFQPVQGYDVYTRSERPAWFLAARAHFTEFVRGRGPLPPLRIGRQPYGILPASSVELWQAVGDDEVIARVVGSFHAAFAERADRALLVGEGADQDATLLDLLSREGSPRRINQWWTWQIENGTVPPVPVGAVPAGTWWPRLQSQLTPLSDEQLAQPETSQPQPDVIEEFPETIPGELRTFLDSRPLSALMLRFDAALKHMRTTGNPVNPETLAADTAAHRETLWQVLNAPTHSYFYDQAEDLYNTIYNTLTSVEPMPEQVSRAITNAESYMSLFSNYVDLEDEAVADLSRTEQLFRETLAPLSHRLDAWVTSLSTSRLSQLRASSPTGIRSGAYGWLTDLEPTGPNPPREGFVVTPSLHHATTAAVLRSGWQAHSDQRAFAVDIQSARARRALAMVEGVRGGQMLGALLGYQFERALHDGHLDRFVAGFREKYPLAPLVDASTPDADAARVSIGARNVVDGQALRLDRANLLDAATLAAAAGADPGIDAAALLRIIAELDETFDAVGDLLLAESVHQLVGGSALRAGLAADAVGRGQELPSDYAVLRTPRSGLAVTHHVGLLLPEPLPSGTGWSNDRPLAQLEPGLEGWARVMLGSITDWSCGAALKTLGWCALDVLAASGETVRGAAANGNAVDDDELDRLDVICTQLRAVLSTARPLNPTHLGQVGGATTTGQDLADLHDRVGTWLAAVRDAGQRLENSGKEEAVASLAGTLASLGLAVGSGTSASVREQLLELLSDVLVDEAALPQLLAPPSVDSDPDAADAWLSELLGTTVALLPAWLVVTPRLTVQLPPTPHPAPIEDELADWWRDMVLVRTQVAAFDTALVVGELIGNASTPELCVLQQPQADGIAGPWLATAPATDEPRIRAALVLECSAGPGSSRGLVVDSWTEVVPRAPGEHGPEEIVGVAFDFDRPGARAPQTMLLAVPPDLARGWCTEDLHACVEETLLLTRLRTLDLADLPELTRLLPISRDL